MRRRLIGLAVACAALTSVTTGVAEANPGLESLGGPQIGLGNGLANSGLAAATVVHRGRAYTAEVVERRMLIVSRLRADGNGWERLGNPLYVGHAGDITAPALLSASDGRLYVAWGVRAREVQFTVRLARLDEDADGGIGWEHVATRRQPGIVIWGAVERREGPRLAEAAGSVWMLADDQVYRLTGAGAAGHDWQPLPPLGGQYSAFRPGDITADDDALYVLYQGALRQEPRVGGAPDGSTTVVYVDIMVRYVRAAGGVALSGRINRFDTARVAPRAWFVGGGGRPAIASITQDDAGSGDDRLTVRELAPDGDDLIRVGELRARWLYGATGVAVARVAGGMAVAVLDQPGRTRVLRLYRIAAGDPSTTIATETTPAPNARFVELTADPAGLSLITLTRADGVSRALIHRP